MLIVVGALIAVLMANAVVTTLSLRFLYALVKSYRTEVQKLTAALISKENPVQAAVYMSHEPERTAEEVLTDRATARRTHLPAGLNGL